MTLQFGVRTAGYLDTGHNVYGSLVVSTDDELCEL